MEKITKAINIYKYDELEETTKNWVVNEYIETIILTTDFSMLNKRTNLYKAFKKSEKMQTPWFLGQYIWEYCEKQILKTLKSHKYFEDGDLYE